MASREWPIARDNRGEARPRMVNRLINPRLGCARLGLGRNTFVDSTGDPRFVVHTKWPFFHIARRLGFRILLIPKAICFRPTLLVHYAL
jgi:hypothetical protein